MALIGTAYGIYGIIKCKTAGKMLRNQNFDPTASSDKITFHAEAVRPVEFIMNSLPIIRDFELVKMPVNANIYRKFTVWQICASCAGFLEFLITREMPGTSLDSANRLRFES